MAESRVSLEREEFVCPICVDLLKDPVAIPCGHSYCQRCITHCWDQEDLKQIYSCPQCRQSFTPRPSLGKNTILAKVVEKLEKSNVQAVQCSSGDVECDVCTGDRNQAIKSCLTCLNSFCQDHLQQHENLFKAKKHTLMDATGQLQEMICPRHEKLLEIFCRTDKLCICYLCTIDEHKNHDTVSAAAESNERQEELTETLKNWQQKIQEKEKKLEDLTACLESQKRSAQEAVEDSEKTFTELMRSIERSFSEVTNFIRDQEKTAVSCTENQLEQLKLEIEDLRRRNTEVEELKKKSLHHINFLKSFQSLSNSTSSAESPNITTSSSFKIDGVAKSVSHLREKLEKMCQEEIAKITGKDEKRIHHHLEVQKSVELKVNLQKDFFADLNESIQFLKPMQEKTSIRKYQKFTL
ncbi:hypothetical protein DNTS_023024 [Danionella cerebrum]|uniref:RING-type domain-containing protein n=1 Tax=Danionella cerebrum TaxID=2873325 RepID=A0A553QM53_9TELE|nr:hypothetical protein DNTS_023024 [Danionella translucida]TRY91007.1 hypothetical protein DNTS_023024 [Danionella translucida]